MRSAMLVVLILVPALSAREEINPQAPKGQFESLLKEYEEATRDVDSAQRAAIWRGLARRAIGLAEENPDDPVAAAALLWIIEEGSLQVYDSHERRVDEVSKAMDLMVRHHLADEGLGRVCLELVLYPSPLRDKFLREVYEKSPDREVRGRACLSLAQYLATKAEAARLFTPPLTAEKQEHVKGTYGWDYLERLLDCDPRSLQEEAEQLFRQVKEEYGDIAYARGTQHTEIGQIHAKRDAANGRTLADAAEISLFEMHHLTLGATAPEIEGEDIDGKTFRLSDYRGKVVVLTFSGNWCGPCVAMYPHERDLVERLKDEPFVLLSVNTDEDQEALREATESGKMTWRCWWDGGTDGPITTAWHVRSFPTIYVIDHEGVIRDKHASDDELDEVVDSLLKEMEPAGKP